MDKVLLAVNGTLMRGLELNENLTKVGGEFIREDETASCYRLWTIDDVHPAMMRVEEDGNNIALEVWKLPKEALTSVLLNEPAGLSIGKVILKDGSIVLGVIGEAILCDKQLEITEYGGWRSYINSLSK